jgi:hypothetical protein
MELESLEYKIVMEQGRDTEVLGRLANLYMATAAYMAAIARCPKRRNRNKSFVSGPRHRFQWWAHKDSNLGPAD